MRWMSGTRASMLILGVTVVLTSCGTGDDVANAAPIVDDGMVPRFRVNPDWPRPLPNGWILGIVSSVAVDERDHVWVLHRPRTLSEEEAPRAAPPVLEFDNDGNFIQGWGGSPGTEQYEWPETEHGVYVDHEDFVWVGGNGPNDQVLKFTRTGEFVMQVGDTLNAESNTNTSRMGGAADTFVHPATNELFVADGYRNRRVIVFDAVTGEFKRMWGAFGNEPVDGRADPGWAQEMEGPGPLHFSQPVHAARVSNDGLVYVSDRGGKRVQVFNLDGTYVDQVFIGRECIAPECGNGNTAASTAFSHDRDQRFLYVGNRSQARVMVLDRTTLEVLDSWGEWGSEPGQFGTLHHMDVDMDGNIYVTEVTPLTPANRRVQRFDFIGFEPARPSGSAP